ncbi:MAG: HAD family hydrolase [Methyloceanibacter sp.]|uniref:HAD family hydrolase n=1 Tax=Methyloceanibacter sp. TaxID=1965321 RepID=UPI003D6D3B5F
MFAHGMKSVVCALGFLVLCVTSSVEAADDPLPSWNDGSVKESIVDFVLRVTTDGSPDYVAPANRIATFDNDGTLWVEQPIYTQFAFAIDRVKATANQHPDWKTKEPFKSVLDGNMKAVASMGEKGMVQIVAATHSGITTVEFNDVVATWFKTAKHPRFKRLYTDLTYKPMIELLEYLRAKEFRTFIVSGGGVEFMRAFTEESYGIPPWQVVGSAGKTEFRMWDASPTLVKLPEVLFVDDGPGKAAGINHYIGRQPIFAFGNSNGDKEMLEWTANCMGVCFMGLVHHTDAVREYAYGPDSPVGTFPDSLMQQAKGSGWTVVNMKDDWKVIFSWEKPSP